MLVAIFNLMKLKEIMSDRIVTVAPDESANAAWTKMRQRRIRHLVVTENKQLVGVLSERDLGGTLGSDVRRGHKVHDLMRTRIATATPDTDLRKAANLMRGRRIGCLPILEGDRLVGIVTATDVLDSLGRGVTRPEGMIRSPLKRVPGRTKGAARQVMRQREPRKRGRARDREADSEERAPFASQIPRATKAVSGRTIASSVPVHIFERRSNENRLNEDDKAYIRRKFGMKLGKFARSIERVTLRLEDVNGPKGGVDQSCRIKVVLSGLPSLMVEERSETINEAIDQALSRTAYAVRSQLQRRRTRRNRLTAFEARALLAKA